MRSLLKPHLVTFVFKTMPVKCVLGVNQSCIAQKVVKRNTGNRTDQFVNQLTHYKIKSVIKTQRI